MAIYKLPSNSDNGKDQEAKSQSHHPEFIYIDETQEQAERVEVFSQEQGEYFESLQNLEKVRYPWTLRVLTSVGAVVLFICSLAIMIAVIATAFVATLLLYRNDTLNQLLASYWRIYRRVIVFTLGLTVATFSPSFGYGIILLYFMLQGETMDDHFISRMMKPKF